MNNRFLMTAAAIAMIAGTGLANAQGAGGAGMSREAPAGGAASRSAPTAAPAADRAAPTERSAPVTRDEATDTSKAPEAGAGTKATQADDKVQRDNGKPSTEANDSKSDPKAAKDMKADGNAGKPDNKAAADSKSPTTTGQAGAGAKLSTEQRTKITTTIKSQNIKPVTNINFSVSIGTRVPRDVGFHPLPAEIVTVYPDWRGYEFFLVRDEIIVVNPRTLEIVAVLEA